MNKRFITALGLTAALSLSACAANEITDPGTTNTSGTGSTSDAPAGLSGTLAGKGASSAKVAQETWSANFQTANPAVTINYSPDGSGAGREAFMGGGADFAGSDRALKTDENVAGAFKGCADTSTAMLSP